MTYISRDPTIEKTKKSQKSTPKKKTTKKITINVELPKPEAPCVNLECPSEELLSLVLVGRPIDIPEPLVLELQKFLQEHHLISLKNWVTVLMVWFI